MMAMGDVHNIDVLTKARRRVSRAVRRSARIAMQNPTTTALATTGVLVLGSMLLKHGPTKVKANAKKLFKKATDVPDRDAKEIVEAKNFATKVMEHYRVVHRYEKSRSLFWGPPRPNKMPFQLISEKAIKYARTYLFGMIVRYHAPKSEKKYLIIPRFEFEPEDPVPVFPKVSAFKLRPEFVAEINTQMATMGSDGHRQFNEMLAMIDRWSPEVAKMIRP